VSDDGAVSIGDRPRGGHKTREIGTNGLSRLGGPALVNDLGTRLGNEYFGHGIQRISEFEIHFW
jgi:hypothetical protein